MPQTADARKLMEQQALDLRARAERFRTFAENARTGLRQTLLDLAEESDAFAARVDAQLQTLGPSGAARPTEQASRDGG